MRSQSIFVFNTTFLCSLLLNNTCYLKKPPNPHTWFEYSHPQAIMPAPKPANATAAAVALVSPRPLAPPPVSLPLPGAGVLDVLVLEVLLLLPEPLPVVVEKVFAVLEEVVLVMEEVVVLEASKRLLVEVAEAVWLSLVLVLMVVDGGAMRIPPV